MEAPGHAAIEFPLVVVGAVEGPFKFKPQTAVMAEFGRDAGADIVPSVVVGLIVANPFRAIQRSQIKGPVASKFMEDVSLEVPGFISIEVFAQAEA